MLGDEVEVLCDRKAQGFVMEQMGALPVLPESIWHRMGDGAGALKRYLRVPGHALATFFAISKFFKEFNHRGHREHRVGVDTQGELQGNAQGTCAGSSELGSLSSKLADSPFSESPARFASATPCFDHRRSPIDARHAPARDSENTTLIRSADSPAALPATSDPLPDTALKAQALDAGLLRGLSSSLLPIHMKKTLILLSIQICMGNASTGKMAG